MAIYFSNLPRMMNLSKKKKNFLTPAVAKPSDVFIEDSALETLYLVKKGGREILYSYMIDRDYIIECI